MPDVRYSTLLRIKSSLEAQGIEYIFGIPGAKIDPVFDALVDSKIKLVVCRHEQNATFIAGGLGRRMGYANKGLLTVAGEAVLDRILARLAERAH